MKIFDVKKSVNSTDFDVLKLCYNIKNFTEIFIVHLDTKGKKKHKSKSVKIYFYN